MSKQLFSKDSHSLVKQYLSTTLYNKLKNRKTNSGYTLDKAIQSGIINPDSDIGLYAGDGETYEIFNEIFDLIIADYHCYSPKKSHLTDFSFSSIPLLDPENKYIVSTRIRLARNLDTFPFPTFILKNQRDKVEEIIIKALKNLPEKLQGQYLRLENILKSNLKSNFYPKKGDRFQEAAGITRDFPDSRGVFLSDNKKFMVWVNEEDHLRIISMEQGSNISSVFNRLGKGIKSLETNLEFSFSKKYGYLTACPSNIGIAMRASVHIKLPELKKQKEFLYKTAAQYGLQIRGTCGEKTRVENFIFDISNKQRLGITENECINILSNGIQKIISIEKKLS